ncbi:hypothetical protein Gasu2_08880 [Galdieria sulphuraria]|uniref:5'-AMP-activated protein kinase-related protein n=1 Tax=Galdieria sulphuraria TaxID=130081 RepID=M2XV02_GALSU|nr:5'-AMP-activated protein kinase-related protein [Galdieria sulphuraria]EME27473.1 5'-AMP-activated protein kinase-related protein [Galdieria sulphuraria]GJD06473.1 hypothetical protein Gasu2_08880 [Galdieria sulphuraria]|eukprot:XP_005703993.1 5'-AMP-activated protein kinase-related protein [Galdieria sulphuraria]
MNKQKTQEKGKQEETHNYILYSESAKVHSNFDKLDNMVEVESPSSVQEIPRSQSGNKSHSSKKPPPPSHGTTSWFGMLPASFTKLFGKRQSESSSQQQNNGLRRHSEPGHQVSHENNSTIGKSTSYPEKINRDTTTVTGEDIYKGKEGTETSPRKVHHTLHNQETVDEDGNPHVGTANESARELPSKWLPKESDPLFHSKQETRGVTTSQSHDEFLNKIGHPRRHSVAEERRSFDSAHNSHQLSLSSDESTPSSSRSRSRSPSGVGHLSNRSGSKEPKFIVPVTGARQLRPNEISRHKYVECLKQKLVPTEFVYKGLAEQVLLMGDWLEWDAIPLQWEEEDDFFRVVVDLPVGEHEFRYVVTPKQENFASHENTHKNNSK